MGGVLALLEAPQPAVVAKGLVALALLTRACPRFLAQALRARLIPQVTACHHKLDVKPKLHSSSMHWLPWLMASFGSLFFVKRTCGFLTHAPTSWRYAVS